MNRVNQAEINPVAPSESLPFCKWHPGDSCQSEHFCWHCCVCYCNIRRLDTRPRYMPPTQYTDLTQSEHPNMVTCCQPSRHATKGLHAELNLSLWIINVIAITPRSWWKRKCTINALQPMPLKCLLCILEQHWLSFVAWSGKDYTSNQTLLCCLVDTFYHFMDQCIVFSRKFSCKGACCGQTSQTLA